MTFIVVRVQNMKGPRSAVELENEWEIKAKLVITTITKIRTRNLGSSPVGVLLT